MSESDVYRRQILTTKVDPRAIRVKAVLLMQFLASNDDIVLFM